MQNTLHRLLPYNCVINQANSLLELGPSKKINTILSIKFQLYSEIIWNMRKTYNNEPEKEKNNAICCSLFICEQQ